MSEKIIPNLMTVDTGLFFRMSRENTRLKELNREMVEALSWAAEHSTSLHLDLLIKIRELLTKAEEEGE